MFRRPQSIHWGLLFVLFLLCSLSIYNLEGTVGPHINNMHIQQLKWFGIATPIMIIFSLVDLHYLRRLAPIVYIIMNSLLVLVLLIGKVVNGSRRWIDLGFFNFQPSELAKLGLIISLAAWFQRYTKPNYILSDILVIASLIGLPMFLVFIEPDLGHTLMLMLITLSMCMIERFDRKSLIGLIIAAVMFLPIAWQFLLKRYQKERILTLIDGKVDKLGAGWHSYQSQVSVGSGGLTGQGKGLGTQVAGGFLPENHTDFVFAKLAEEHGFLGSSFTLLLYLALLLSIMYTVYTARDRFSKHLALGIAAFFFWHIMMNVGMVLNLLPVTGVTLPILSYGGTSLVTVFIALGLVLACHGQRQVFER